MAYTYSEYTGVGSGPYSIGFEYLEPSSITVKVDGTVVPFSFTGTPSEQFPAGTAVLLPPDTSGNVRIYKDVDMGTPVVNWADGTELSHDSLQVMNRNLMEMAQTAYDVAAGSLVDSQAAQNTVNTLLSSVNALVAQAASFEAQAEYWAGVAQSAGSIANPAQTTLDARDAAIAARDAAVAARNAAQAAQALAETAKAAAQSSASSAAASQALADNYANAAKNTQVTTGKYSARHYAETAQAIVDAGSLRWNGSAKFVSTTDPDPAQGVNGDIWFKREV